MTQFLKELVTAESPSTDPRSQGHVMDLIAWSLEEAGHRARLLPGRETGGHLFARPRGHRRGQPIQMLVGHCDTVWPLGTLSHMPVEVEKNVLRGPGSFDMKGGLAQMVYALRAIHELGLAPIVTPVVLVNSDEEIGSHESTRWIRMLARRSDRAMVLEPALGQDGRIKTARKGIGQFRVTIRGVSAHTGLDPGKGASAIQELSHVVLALHALTDLERGITVNVGQIQGGFRPNVVAPESSAVVDVRVPTMEIGREVEHAIRSLKPITPGTTIEVHGSVDRPPLERTPRNRRLWQAAEEVAAELGLFIEEGSAGGGSDGNTTSLFTATLDGLGSVGDGAHAQHEFVFVDQMAKRAALLAGLLLQPPLREGRPTNGTSARVAGEAGVAG
jgi:glutamate carboxypeptidase